uniref:Uncharacterized protein n=1 Tax=Candidozyma auris TaxID=498019 RepID=A0A0L0P291_CANAR
MTLEEGDEIVGAIDTAGDEYGVVLLLWLLSVL